jgi:hypothetical protein
MRQFADREDKTTPIKGHSSEQFAAKSETKLQSKKKILLVIFYLVRTRAEE